MKSPPGRTETPFERALRNPLHVVAVFAVIGLAIGLVSRGDDEDTAASFQKDVAAAMEGADMAADGNNDSFIPQGPDGIRAYIEEQVDPNDPRRTRVAAACGAVADEDNHDIVEAVITPESEGEWRARIVDKIAGGGKPGAWCRDLLAIGYENLDNPDQKFYFKEQG